MHGLEHVVSSRAHTQEGAFRPFTSLPQQQRNIAAELCVLSNSILDCWNFKTSGKDNAMRIMDGWLIVFLLDMKILATTLSTSTIWSKAEDLSSWNTWYLKFDRRMTSFQVLLCLGALTTLPSSSSHSCSSLRKFLLLRDSIGRLFPISPLLIRYEHVTQICTFLHPAKIQIVDRMHRWWARQCWVRQTAHAPAPGGNSETLWLLVLMWPDQELSIRGAATISKWLLRTS